MNETKNLLPADTWFSVHFPADESDASQFEDSELPRETRTAAH